MSTRKLMKFNQEYIQEVILSLSNLDDFKTEIRGNLPDDFEVNIDFQYMYNLEEKKELYIVFSSKKIDFTLVKITDETTPKEVADRIISEST